MLQKARVSGGELEDGSWEAKAAYWQGLSDAEPNKIKYALEWSLAAQKLSRFQDVIRACDRILVVNDDYKTALLRRANALDKLALPHVVSASWRQVAKRLPDEVTPYKKLVHLYRRYRRKAVASAIAWIGLHKFPQDQDLICMCLSLPPEDAHLQEWVSLWLQQASLPVLAQVLPDYGSVLGIYDKGQFEDVIALSELALVRAPEAQKYEKLMYRAMQSSGQEEHLISYLETHLREGKLARREIDKLARVYEARGQWMQALALLDSLLPDHLDDENARFARNVLERMLHVHLADRDTSSALSVLLGFVARYGSQPVYWRKYIKALNEGGFSQSAVEAAIEHGYEFHSEDAYFIDRMARQQFHNGDYAAASDKWWVVFLQTQQQPIALRAVRSALKDGALPRAEEMLQQTLDMCGPSDEHDHLRAWILRRQYRWDELQKVCVVWTQRTPESSAAWLLLVESCYRLEDDEQAWACFAKARRHLEGRKNTLGTLLKMAERIGADTQRKDLEQQCRSQNSDADLVDFLVQQGRVGEAYPIICRLRAVGDETMPSTWSQACAVVDAMLATGVLLEEIRSPETIVQAIIDHVDTQEAISGHKGIAVVTRSLGGGGAERQVAMTLQGLVEAGQTDISLVTHLDREGKDDDFYGSLLEELHIPVWTPNPQNPVDYTDPELKRLVALLPDNYRKQVVGHYDVFKRLKPQIAHVWQDALNCSAGLAAYMAGVPKIILSGRTMPPLHPRSRIQSPSYLRPIYQALCRAPSVQLCANSQTTAAAYAAWLNCDPSEVGVIHNGLDISKLDLEENSTADALQVIDPSRPVVGAVFRFVWQKHPDLWLQVARLVLQHRPDCQFLLVGDGPLRQQFLRKLQEAGVAGSFFLPGKVRNVKAYLQNMDVFLMTSVVEGLPNVVMEAQAIGVPVVTTAAGGAAEIVDHGQSGWVVPLPPIPHELGDLIVAADSIYEQCAHELAQHIICTLDDEQWMKQAGWCAKSRMQKYFGLSRMIADTLATYRNE